MAERGKRFNFAYVGEAPPEWTAQLEWGRKIRVLAGDVEDDSFQEPPPKGQGIPGRWLAPDFRRRPDQCTAPLKVVPELAQSFPVDGPIDFRLEAPQVYSSGVSLQVIAREKEALAPGDAGYGECTRMNLSFRLRPDRPHRVRFIVGCPDKTILSNMAHPSHWPDDPEAPWLSGGGDFQRTDSGLVVVGADYFLSPTPTAGQMYLYVAYPEFDVELSGIVIDTALFAS